MPKSPKRGSSDYMSSVGLGDIAGLSTHVSVLWLLLLFVFITVCVCTYGGLHEGLGKREFPDTNVNGDLSVEGVTTARSAFKYLTTTGNHELQNLEKGDHTIIVNAALAAGKYIRLPEATTSNGGMHIRIIFGLAPAAAAHVGFVTTKIVGGATSISDATEGAATAAPALKSSAVGTSNLRLDLDVDDVAKAGGYPGTIIDFFYTGVENVVLMSAQLIGDVDTPTLASLFSTTAINA